MITVQSSPVYRCRYGPKFSNWLPVFLEKSQAVSQSTDKNQNFIILWRFFFYSYLFVTLWHFSHISLPYQSGDGFIFFIFFVVCRALGLLLRPKSNKHKGSVSLPVLFWWETTESYISVIIFGWMAARLDQTFHLGWFYQWRINKYW